MTTVVVVVLVMVVVVVLIVVLVVVLVVVVFWHGQVVNAIVAVNDLSVFAVVCEDVNDGR